MSTTSQLYQQALQHYHGKRYQAAMTMLAQQPNDLSAQLLYGSCLRRIHAYGVATVHYQRLLDLHPQDASLRLNYANLLIDAGNPEQAVAVLQHEQVQDKSAQRTQALALFYSNRFAEAAELFRALLQQDETNTDYQWHLSLCLLALAQWPQAFELYEARKQLREYGNKRFADRVWNSLDEVSGRSVLLYTEQGFGDNIQFARFIPLLQQAGAEVTLVVRPALKRLFNTIEGIRVVVDAKDAEYDFVASLLSLPLLMPDSFEAAIEHIGRVFQLPASTQERPQDRPLTVGLLWSGKLRPKNRSIALAELAPLLAVPNVRFTSLQLPDINRQISAEGMQVYISEPEQPVADFYDLAVAIESVDLVVSIDSAPLHVALMLNKPVVALLLNSSDWRWHGGENDDSAWYPQATLLRQSQQGGWRDVVMAAQAILKERAA